MIVPAQRDEVLLADMAKPIDDPDHFRLWWLGQSGFLLKWRSKTVLFDPYLSDSLTVKYSGTDKEHIRMTERCVAPERLGFVTVVTSSHAHTDHFDAQTLVLLARAHGNALPLVLPTANLALAKKRLEGAEFTLLGLDAGVRMQIEDFEFVGISAAHDTIERDENGHCRFLGFIVRFGRWTVYHSGDTRWHDELPSTLSGYRPDLVLVPINGHDPARRVAGNLNGMEAAALAKACGASVAIPHHFEMFTFNTAAPDEFTKECEWLDQPFALLRCGEGWDSRGITPRNLANA